MYALQTYEPTSAVMRALEMLSANLAQERRANVNRRGKDRKTLEALCRIFFFVQGDSRTSSLPARTRNISNKGIGLVVKRCFHEGEPIEIAINRKGKPPMHMAGLVRFCRYVADGFFEIGVELMYAGDAPIFSENPIYAMQQLPWLEEALRRKNESAFAGCIPRKRPHFERLMR